MSPEQKADAVEYVKEKYCLGSGDNIETDADHESDTTHFSEGDDGVWVRGWLWVPKEAIMDYGVPAEEGDD